MKGQFAFLPLVLFCGKPGKILEDAAEMGLVIEARLVSNLGERPLITVHKFYSTAKFFVDDEVFCRNAEQCLSFAVQLPR